MTLTETITYLQNDGFYGARVVGSSEIIYPHKNGVTVHIGENERVITLAQFEAQFAGARFRKQCPTEV